MNWDGQEIIRNKTKRITISLYCQTELTPRPAMSVNMQRENLSPINEQLRDESPSLCDDDVFVNDEIWYSKPKRERWHYWVSRALWRFYNVETAEWGRLPFWSCKVPGICQTVLTAGPLLYEEIIGVFCINFLRSWDRASLMYLILTNKM